MKILSALALLCAVQAQALCNNPSALVSCINQGGDYMACELSCQQSETRFNYTKPIPGPYKEIDMACEYRCESMGNSTSYCNGFCTMN